MSRYYGVLRVVRVRSAPDVALKLPNTYPSGLLPQEKLLHVLTARETVIGRALENDLILMDSTISREHARLVWNGQYWCIYNLTQRNSVHVNGQPVLGGESMRLNSQDFLVLGCTTLQLIAPEHEDDAWHEQLAHMLALTTMEMDALSRLEQVTNDGPQRELESFGTVEQTPDAEPSAIARTVVSKSDAAQPEEWIDSTEGLLGAGVTMQFALPLRLSGKIRGLIIRVGIAIVVVSVLVMIGLNALLGFPNIARNGSPSLLLVLTIPLVPAIGITLLVNFIDRFEREPWFLRLTAFLWGAIIAIPTALIEQHVDLALLNVLGSDDLLRSIFRGLDAGIAEETVKGLGLLLLFFVLRDEFDNVTDGIVYGALIGAGFAMVENFVYFAQYAKEFLLFLIVGRVVLGWLCHSTFTVCFGAALGYVRHTRVRWKQITLPLLGYLCAVGLHSAFDFINFYANALVLAYPENSTVGFVSLIAIVGNYIPPFIAQIILLYFLIRALAHEGAVIREFLVSEVRDSVVLVDEYALLQHSFQRTRVERQVLWKYGIKQWLRVRALYQTEIGLAFRKWHVSMGDKPKLGYIQPEDAYRKRIQYLRQEIRQGQEKRQELIL
ncbi:MAG TPA: PrsW family glutamic-type intramembrane protease [Ktedonobacteraceae bacterium]|jgi:RsiW-degrading membrane proteinase PrsW (M82 family)|nr:PrsW family glutamic-type intramembrane protease [Ktedonobacteraceae bacterium]